MSVIARLSAARSSWWLGTRPDRDGLPNLRVTLAFPVLVLIGTLLLTAFTVNGNSSGYARSALESGRDPALIAGHPQSIRSDDWNVNAPLTIAQYAQGLPERNRSLVGGQDAAVPQDLPRADWSVVFRPQLWGFPVTDLGHAVAWRWWAPAATCLALAYLFAVTLLPRRPILAVLAALGFTVSPFFQWWFQSVSFWPIAWALAASTALIWAARSSSRPARWGWAAAAGFLTPVAAMGVYAPYLIPVVVVTVAFGVGVLARTARDDPRHLTRFVPVVLAGLVGAAVTLLWLRSKKTVVDQLVDTVYPGERLSAPGSGGALSVVRTLSSSFTEALERNAGFLGMNSSEASTFFLLGAFALPSVVWLCVFRARRGLNQPYALIAVSAAILLLAAFVVIPGWEPIAHLLFLDRTTDTRLRIGLGLASFLVMVLLIRELDETAPTRAGVVIGVISGIVFLTSQVAIAAAFIHVKSARDLAAAAPLWLLIAAGCGVAVVLVTSRYALIAVAIFAAFSVGTSALVNPVYLGIYNMRTTDASRAIQKMDSERTGRWVPLGDSVVIALVTESGVRSYAGIQGAPQPALWREIDPRRRFEPQWNRLANIGYEADPGIGEPIIENPAPDQILVRFDPCDRFAQKRVTYVASDVSIPSRCLSVTHVFTIPGKRITLYRVVAPS